jgi:hypothetical protein
MGQNNSRSYNDSNFIPAERLFKLSYTLYKTLDKPVEKSGDKPVDISRFFEEYHHTIGILMQFLYFLTKESGYTLKPTRFEWGYMSIEGILHQINLKGFPVINNDFIKDIKLTKNCYKPDLNVIYSFLSRGKPLLAMVLLEPVFIMECLKLSSENLKDIATDAVIIVGYDTHHFYIKTNWFEFIVKVENRFIDNFKELWDVSLQTLF